MRYLAVLVFVLVSNLAHALHVEKLTLPLPSGRTIEAELRIPETKAPVILLFGGFENAGEVLDLVHPKAPVALASFNYPFKPERRFEFPRSLKAAPELKRMIPDTRDGIKALLHVLSSRTDIDSTRITIVGASFGSPFALQAAADNPGLVKGVAIVHGFGKIRKTAEHVILRSWVPRYGYWAYPAVWLLTWGGYFYLDLPSPEDAAASLTAGQKVLMVSAEHDTFIPPEASEALWHGLEKSASKHQRIVMEGEHLLPGSAALIERILLVVQEWMKQEKLL